MKGDMRMITVDEQGNPVALLATNLPEFRSCVICSRVRRKELCDNPIILDDMSGYACNTCVGWHRDKPTHLYLEE